MDVLGLAMYEEVYSITLQCEGCESVLPGTVEQHGFKSRGELSEVQFLINIGQKKSFKLRYSDCIYASSQKMFI